jgi:hypothetical protein
MRATVAAILRHIITHASFLKIPSEVLNTLPWGFNEAVLFHESSSASLAILVSHFSPVATLS